MSEMTTEIISCFQKNNNVIVSEFLLKISIIIFQWSKKNNLVFHLNWNSIPPQEKEKKQAFLLIVKVHCAQTHSINERKSLRMVKSTRYANVFCERDKGAREKK